MLISTSGVWPVAILHNLAGYIFGPASAEYKMGV